MNKDDNIELLDTSGKVNSTVSDNSKKVSTPSEMLGNQILSGLDSSSPSIHSNDYFTSTTIPNMPSVSSEVVQPNFQTLDSMSNVHPNVPSASSAGMPSSVLPDSSIASVSHNVQSDSIPDNTTSLSVENKYRASSHTTMDHAGASSAMTSNVSSSDISGNSTSLLNNAAPAVSSSPFSSTVNNTSSAASNTPPSSNRTVHIPDLSKRDRMSAFMHSSDTHGSDTGSTNNNAVNNKDSNNNSTKATKPVIFLIIFILLLLVIVFLPNIGEFFSSIFPKSDVPVDVAELENGSLTCTLEHEEDGISYFYTDTYDFKNRKVENLQHVVSIQSGTDFLNQRNMECQTLKQAASTIRGISVDCNLSSGEMVETQFFNFSSLRGTDISTEFVEAGGVYPNVEYGDDISEIEKNLTISGYECSES